jgi:hypothetical protein
MNLIKYKRIKNTYNNINLITNQLKTIIKYNTIINYHKPIKVSYNIIIKYLYYIPFYTIIKYNNYKMNNKYYNIIYNEYSR